jgi:Na+/citrate or Na+/malate symporter
MLGIIYLFCKILEKIGNKNMSLGGKGALIKEPLVKKEIRKGDGVTAVTAFGGALV